VRQQREAEDQSDPRALGDPARVTRENERRRGGPGDRERERMGEPAVRDGPSEEIDVGQGGAGSRDEADPSRRRRLLSPGADRKAHGCVREGCRHRAVSG